MHSYRHSRARTRTRSHVHAHVPGTHAHSHAHTRASPSHTHTDTSTRGQDWLPHRRWLGGPHGCRPPIQFLKRENKRRGGKRKEKWRACWRFVTILFSSLQSSSSLGHPGFPCRVWHALMFLRVTGGVRSMLGRWGRVGSLLRFSQAPRLQVSRPDRASYKADHFEAKLKE